MIVATTETGSHLAPDDLAADGLEASLPITQSPVGELRKAGLISRAQLTGGDRRPARRIYWWFEISLAVWGYMIYAQARETHGASASDYRQLAVRHGRDLFKFEKFLGLDWERGLQHNLLPYKGFLQVVGGFYGGAHFVVTIGVLVFLLFRRPQFYRFWRTCLFVLTLAAVGCFALYPAMPPRLLKDGTGHTITVDTLDKVGGLWSYNHGVIEHISDGYAPMPSLHLGWATWVAMALWFALPARSRWRRTLVLCYPLAVYFTVIATGTHFVIDGVAGMALTAAVVLACAWLAVRYRRWRLLRTGHQAMIELKYSDSCPMQ